MHSLMMDIVQSVYGALAHADQINYRRTCKTFYHTPLLIDQCIPLSYARKHTLRQYITCISIRNQISIKTRKLFANLITIVIEAESFDLNNDILQCAIIRHDPSVHSNHITLASKERLQIKRLGNLRELHARHIFYQGKRLESISAPFDQLEALTTHSLCIHEPLLRMKHLHILHHLKCMIKNPFVHLKTLHARNIHGLKGKTNDINLQWPISLHTLIVEGINCTLHTLPSQLKFLSVQCSKTIKIECELPESLRVFILPVGRNMNVIHIASHVRIYEKEKHMIKGKDMHYRDVSDKIKVMNHTFLQNNQHLSDLKYLRVNYVMVPCPLQSFSLTHLHIDRCDKTLLKDFLPATLTHLTLGRYNDQIHLPSTLTHLNMRTFNQRECVWPSSLKSLIMPGYNQPFRHALPDTLETLKLNRFNQIIIHRWPIHLTYLEMKSFNTPLSLPFTRPLLFLDMRNYCYNFQFTWPSSLKYAILSEHATCFYPLPC